MRRATLVNLRKNEAMNIEIKQDGKPYSVLVTPGNPQSVAADNFQSVQIKSLVARAWLRLDQETEIVA